MGPEDWIWLKVRSNASIMLQLVDRGYDIFAVMDFWRNSPEVINLYNNELSVDIYVTKEIMKKTKTNDCEERITSNDYASRFKKLTLIF